MFYIKAENLQCYATRQPPKEGAADKQPSLDTYSLLFPLLFDHVGEDFSTGLSLSVQKVGRHCSLRGLIIILLLGLPLFMHFDAAKIQVRIV